MFTRITTTHVSPYRLEEAISLARDTLSSASQQKGYKGHLMLADRGTGKVLTITFWQDESDRQVTDANSTYYRESISKLVPFLTAAPAVEDFEVVLQTKIEKEISPA